MHPGFQRKAKSYVELIRPFTLIPPAVGVVAGALLAIGFYGRLSLFSNPEEWVKFDFAPVALGAVLYAMLNGASNAYNQVSDLEIDRINRPGRPIPKRELSVREALGFAGIVYFFGLAGAYLISFPFFCVTALCLLITTLYSTPPIYLKKRFLVSNITIALCQGILFLLAGWVIYPFSNPLEPTFWFIGLILFVFLVGACGTKDFTEVEGDRRYGMRTLAVLYGSERAVKITGPFFILPLLLIPAGILSSLLPLKAVLLSVFLVYGSYVYYNLNNLIIPRRKGENSPAWLHYYFMLMGLELGFSAVFLM